MDCREFSCHILVASFNTTKYWKRIYAAHNSTGIWKAVLQTYTQLGNDAQVYELVKKEQETRQGEWSLAEYYAEQRLIWQEIDYYEDFQADCTLDARKYKCKIDKQRVCCFLAGLNQEYDHVRAHILGREPFLTLMQAYASIQSQESSRNIMVNVIPQEKST